MALILLVDSGDSRSRASPTNRYGFRRRVGTKWGTAQFFLRNKVSYEGRDRASHPSPTPDDSHRCSCPLNKLVTYVDVRFMIPYAPLEFRIDVSEQCSGLFLKRNGGARREKPLESSTNLTARLVETVFACSGECSAWSAARGSRMAVADAGLHDRRSCLGPASRQAFWERSYEVPVYFQRRSISRGSAARKLPVLLG